MFFKKDKSRVVDKNPDELPGGKEKIISQGVFSLKIDIIGSVASGKTTLAKRISKKYGIPYYEKDNIVWKRTLNGDVKRK